MNPYINKLPRIGKYFFLTGMMAIAIQHFVFNDFVLGRAPAWPMHVPGKTLWAYITGSFFFITGLMIIGNIQARRVALMAAALIFVWAFLRYLPIVVSDSLLAPSWTSAGKAIVFIGGLLVIAATASNFKSQGRQSKIQSINSNVSLIAAGRICLSLFLLITGLQHFIYVEFVASLIPEWFPGNAVFWTYFAGVALLCGGLGLLIPKTAALAAFLSGTMIFSWFWIVHLPRAVESLSDNIAVFEAFAFSGIAFILIKADNLKQE